MFKKIITVLFLMCFSVLAQTTINGVPVKVTNLAVDKVTSITADPASSGIVRLAKTDTICWRNNGNSADICLSLTSGDLVVIPDSQITNLTSVTVNPAASGVLRLAKTDQACWRNNANTADVCASLASDDSLAISNGVTSYIISPTANPASAGQIRLAKTDVIAIRNNANSGDLNFGINSTDQPIFDGVRIVRENFAPFVQTQSVTVANTVTETTLVGTGVGSVTLPANFFTVGKTIKLRMWGFHSSTANPNITINLKLGGTTIATTGARSSGNGSNNTFEIDAIITCRTTGSTGTIFTQGAYDEIHPGGLVADLVNTTTNTIDTTGTLAMDITVTWGTASSSNTITATNFVIEDTL